MAKLGNPTKKKKQKKTYKTLGSVVNKNQAWLVNLKHTLYYFRL